MKLFEIPMVVATLLGFCFLPDAQVPAARADFTFGPRVNLGPTVNSLQIEGSPIISRNGLELYFSSTNRPGGYGGSDIWMSERASVEDPWGPAVNLGPGINSAADEGVNSISSDGLTLYLDEETSTYLELYTSTRPAMDAPWGPRVNMGPLINSAWDFRAVISPNDLELYFASNRPGTVGAWDIYVSTRTTPNDPWGLPVNLDPTVNTAQNEIPEAISPDGLILFWISNRPGEFGRLDMWMTWRPYKDAAWSVPVNLGPSFNTPNDDTLFSISADGHWVYVGEYWAGPTNDVWMAPIIPIVDFNGDGKVDGKDVLCMVAHWGTDDPVCDIGPFAWGDGTVDLQDLVVLADYLGEEFIDPTLLAHWALDESEGGTAKDSVGGEDAFVIGEPVWQPTGGMVGGALELDGVDDCIITSFALDPSEGPFSILAWVKGGAPGQVVISHSQGFEGDNLLMVRAEGKLVTEFGSSDGTNNALLSETDITDGKWHRVGLVWDGSYRHLYVDGAEVASDAEPLNGLESGEGGVYIGASNGMEPGSLWSGLIDDVRIYNRVVSP